MEQNAAVPQPQAPNVNSSVVNTAPSGKVYAGFLMRLCALLVDSVLVGIVGFVIGMALQLVAPGDKTAVSAVTIIGSVVNMVIGFGYYIYFTGTSGQTLGKKALGIKVVQMGSDGPIGYVNAFLREVVGKFISSLVFGLGYLWVIWDKDKQGWHDKIAKTVVIKV